MPRTSRKHRKPSISLLNVNTQLIGTKEIELQYTVEDAKYDIIGACDTWFKPSINSSEFMPPGYDPPFRNGRADGYGDDCHQDWTCRRTHIYNVNVRDGRSENSDRTATPLVVTEVYRPTYNNFD